MWCAGIAKHNLGGRQHAPPSSSLSLSLLWALGGKRKDSLDRGHWRKHLFTVFGFSFFFPPSISSFYLIVFRFGAKQNWDHPHKDLTDLGMGRGKAVSASLDARLRGVTREFLVCFFSSFFSFFSRVGFLLVHPA